jgi:hypothetical protein
MLTTSSGRYKVRATTTRAGGRVLLFLLVAASSLPIGCRPDPSTARGTAERFLDAHYVRIDLDGALAYTSGLGLTRGQPIDETTRKPSVHYTFLEEHADGEQAVNFLYRGTIAVEDADRFQRRWLVTVRREETGWRVTNWQELAE